MVYEINQSTESIRDFFGVLDYMTENLFNPQAARKFNNELESCYNRLRKYPLMYPLCPNEALAARGFRCAQVMRYMVFYTVNEEECIVWIHRILHITMDYAQQEI